MPSSVIRSMLYDPAERSLDIEFRDGRGVYRYFDVPAAEWKAFLAAPSKGTYLNQTFKDAGYGYEKVEASPSSSCVNAELGWQDGTTNVDRATDDESSPGKRSLRTTS